MLHRLVFCHQQISNMFVVRTRTILRLFTQENRVKSSLIHVIVWHCSLSWLSHIVSLSLSLSCSNAIPADSWQPDILASRKLPSSIQQDKSVKKPTIVDMINKRTKPDDDESLNQRIDKLYKAATKRDMSSYIAMCVHRCFHRSYSISI
jgi:hypothetical protein